MLRKIISKMYDTQHTNSLITNQINTIFFRQCSKTKADNYLGVSYEPDFTDEQKKYLLQIFNNSNFEELSRFNLSKNRIKKIDAWRNKNGAFHSLTEVLDVDGLGVKMLHRLCTNIIEAENKDDSTIIKQKPVKARGQILTPTLSTEKLNNLHSALGIHLFSAGVSWARVEKGNNYLTNWDYVNYNISSGKKLTPTDALQIVLKVCDELPPSDVYVFEAPISVTPTAQQSPISVSAYAQRVQLLSMMMTVLSTSPEHNPDYIQLHTEQNHQIKNLTNFEPNVYFLRHRLPARLFRTLIGTERVSAATTISKILDNTKPEKGLNYSPLTIDSELTTMYDNELPVNKEVIGQALLLTMAFMDVCVYHNVKSIKAISSTRS